MTDKKLTKRLDILEGAKRGVPGQLSLVVPDKTTDAKIERLQAAGHKVFRESDPATR